MFVVGLFVGLFQVFGFGVRGLGFGLKFLDMNIQLTRLNPQHVGMLVGLGSEF